MSDFSNHVIMPREDFVELSQVAFDNNHVPSLSERTASVAQTAAVFGILTGFIVGSSWGWAKAIDWLEQRKFDRAHDRAKKADAIHLVK